MACKRLLSEHDVSCIDPYRKYYQQLVLVNLEDVNEVAINETAHSILFNLVESATGYRYRGNENVALYSASFSKSTSKGQPFYAHSVNLPIVGVGSTTKAILRELDLSNYFAAIQFKDGTVEIYGFENGLKTSNYTYEAQNGMGGTSITLESKFDENEPPYVYAGIGENFDNKFAGIGDLFAGDFNDDFENDFYIVEA